MSRVWTWRQAIFESDLQATTKLVLQALASHLNDMGGPMFPSQERLAKLCSLSERSVITHLQIAEDGGWIVASKREKQGSKWAANEYVARFPDGVKEIHPMTTGGVKQVHLRGEGDSCGGVKEVHTNSPSELSREQSPHTPKGAVGWEFDPLFGKVCDAYAKLNPTRVDTPKAWAVWLEKQLAGEVERLLAVLPTFAAFDQWKKEGGKFIPSLSKWLANGAWRNVDLPATQNPAETAERERMRKEAMPALARVEFAERIGKEPEADDLAAVARWRGAA